MSALEIFVLVYSFGWLATAGWFGWRMLESLDGPDNALAGPEYTKARLKYPRATPVLTALLFVVLALAVGSVWWVFLLGRLAVFVWHHAGHPGAE